jgi:hypothetical protein
MSIDTEKFERLQKYLSGRMNSKERKAFEKELVADPVLADMADFLKAEKSGSLDHSFEDLRQAAHSLLDRQLIELEQAGRDNPRAVTLFDSKLLPLPEGVRPAVVDTRRLRYKIGQSYLDISIYPISLHSFEMIGQLSDRDEDQRLSVKLVGDDGRFEVEANQFAMFRFEKIPADSYEMTIRSGSEILGRLIIEL